MGSPLGAWLKFEERRLSCARPDDLSVTVPEGLIRVVRCPNGEYVGRIEWRDDYGERDFIRGTWDVVHLAAREQVLRGVSVSPQYRSSKEPELIQDRLYHRMSLPDGELRILRFGGLYVGVLIPQDGIRILAWSDNLEDALLGSRHAIAPRETFRMAIKLGGMRREFRVSATPGVLAYVDVLDETFIVVPETPFKRDEALNLWDAPVALLRLRDGELVGCVARFESLMELDGNDVLWSDESSASRHVAPTGEVSMPVAGTRTAGHRASSPAPSSVIPPRICRLFRRCLDELDLDTGPSPGMRRQVDRALRECATREAKDITGCGERLRAALEERSGITLDGRPRAFRYASAFYRKHLPPGFCIENGREQTYAFGELREGTSLVRWLEDKYGHLEPHDGPAQSFDWLEDEPVEQPEPSPDSSDRSDTRSPEPEGSASRGNRESGASGPPETPEPAVDESDASRAEQERARVTALLMQPRPAARRTPEQIYADAAARFERLAHSPPGPESPDRERSGAPPGDQTEH